MRRVKEINRSLHVPVAETQESGKIQKIMPSQELFNAIIAGPVDVGFQSPRDIFGRSTPTMERID